MATALLSIEVLVGALVVLVCVALAGVFVRRRVLAKDSILTLCGMRRRSSSRWRLGLLRLGSTQLEWFPLLGVTTRPVDGWERNRVDLDAPVLLEGHDRLDLLPDAVGVQSHVGEVTFELALLPEHYTALRSWLEAAPPGSRANVA
ncbi:MAG: DUF2550 domain-containing protein [Actinomycetota bacterium]|nr:DUF2550 domain-containing protein [Actinomycetota bacterium]